MPASRLRVWVITNLFPSNAAPDYSPFNRQQFAKLGRLCDVEVFAVVPWRFGLYYAGVSSTGVVLKEQIDDLPVFHPRYPQIRGLPSMNGSLMAAALLPELLRRRPRADVLLASYAYPDGCSAVLLGQALGLPVVVKCHGSDLNRVPKVERWARLQIRLLLPRAERVVVVSDALGEAARSLGVAKERIRRIYNGIDRRRFFVLDQKEARKKIGISPEVKLVVCVSHLAEHKGTRDLLLAAPELERLAPGAVMAFVGDGPLLPEVEAAQKKTELLGPAGIPLVRAVGKVPHDRVATWMSASDVVCLPSWDEGMPNVVREAHAVGRPVVATCVGGIPEAIFTPELGQLVPPRDPHELARALANQLSQPSAPPERIVELAHIGGWEDSAAQLFKVIESAVETAK